MQQTLNSIFYYFSGIVTSYLFFIVISKSKENKQIEYLSHLSQKLMEEEEINKKNSQYIGEILNSIDIINTSLKEKRETSKATAPIVEEEVLLTESEKKELNQSEAQLVLKEWLLGGEE